MNEHDRFIAEFHAHFTRDPNQRVELGVDRDLGRLPDPSQADVDTRVTEARALLARLDSVTRTAEGAGGLGADGALDLDLARLKLESEVHALTCTIDGQPRGSRLPLAGVDIGEPLVRLMLSDPRPIGDRLADVAGRLEGCGEYVDALLARLETPVARWVEADADAASGLPDLFAAVDDAAADAAWPDRPRLRRAIRAATAAIGRYVHELRAMPSTTRFHLGAAAAERTVASRGIDVPLAELHRWAIDFLAETSRTQEELRRRLVERHELPSTTDVSALRAFLDQRFQLPERSATAVLRRYQTEHERLVAFIAERDLFPILDDQAVEILATPPFLEPLIPAGAMMEPPPFRDATRKSLVYLTLADDRLATHSELYVPLMLLHEAIPGHHLHLATACEHPSVVRRHMASSDQAEGWTTMLEDYLLDVDYMGPLTDEARFVAKQGVRRIGARVAIDLFFMSGDAGYLDVGVPLGPYDVADPFAAAGALLAATTEFTPPAIEGELTWYSQEPGYPLSYLSGNRMTWQLKQDMAAKTGRHGLDLDRAFHAAFLDAGNMPMRFLRLAFANAGLIAG